MTDREVMQQALEALDSENPDIQLRAALALRTALAQEQALKKLADLGQEIEQEPVISAWSLREVYFDDDGEPIMHRSPPAAQPEQEPVAKLFGTLPVFDTPPKAQRPWVGLTDEEVAIASAEFDLKSKIAYRAGMYKAQIILRKKNDSTY